MILLLFLRRDRRAYFHLLSEFGPRLSDVPLPVSLNPLGDLKLLTNSYLKQKGLILSPLFPMAYDISESYFNEEVLNAPVPVLVHFWAPWCGVCRLIKPVLYQFQLESKSNLKLIEVNADSSLHLANTYRLKSLPTLILFEQGQPTYRLDHVSGRDELYQQLKSLDLTLNRTAAFR